MGAVDWEREEGWDDEVGREVWVQVEVSLERAVLLSARRREMLRPLRNEEADWRDLASWLMLAHVIVVGIDVPMGLTLKMSTPVLRRRSFVTSIFSGSGISGVSILSLRPYLCGLSSGRGGGAGIEGESVSPRFAGGAVAHLCCSVSTSSRFSTNEVLVSARDPIRLSMTEPRIVVEALSGRLALSSVIVIVDAECTTSGTWSGGGLLDDETLMSRKGSIGLSSFGSSLCPSNVDCDTC